MSVVSVYSAHIVGLDASPVQVEVDLSSGLYSFTIVGLPDKSALESKDRVFAALKNSGFGSIKTENHKVVVSLSPGDVKKEGAHFDLPIAIGYLLASKKINTSLKNKLFVGELSLTGSVLPAHGVLSMAQLAKERGIEELYVPYENREEAALVGGIRVYGIKTLEELVSHLEKQINEVDERYTLIEPTPKTTIEEVRPDYFLDFKDIRGQETAKRALEIAALGGHNIALYGPPGTGKTMLARAFCGILPPLQEEQVLEVTRIHSVSGKSGNIITRAPFRSPHHTASYVSLVGGGQTPKPGEITLAHHGVLFLDEFPEFDKKVIESLREPLEEGSVTISRSKGTLRFPAQSITIIAMNPCPCGYYGSNVKQCTCTRSDIERYTKKLSGPIVDRIDIWVPVQHIDYGTLTDARLGEETKVIRERVKKARAFGCIRNTINEKQLLNKELSSHYIEEKIPLHDDVRETMNTLAKRFILSPRAYHRVLRVARSIADLEGKEHVEIPHIMEAFQYRPKEFI